MQQLLLQFTRLPWLWLGLLLTATLIAASQVDDLEVRISADDMFVADDPLRAYHREVEAAFDGREIVLVVAAATDPVTAERVDALAKASAQLATLTFVERVDSLLNVPHIKSVDGFLDQRPYIDRLQAPAADDNAALDAALDNPLLRGTLVAADGSALGLAVVLRELADSADDELVSEAIETAIEPLRANYDRVYAIGFPQIRSELAQRVFNEQLHLFPYAVGALLLALFLLLRQLLDIVTPLVTATVSIVWTFGVMGWLGIPLNVLTSTVPILLIVVGSTEDIHMLAEFRRAQRDGMDNREAIVHMARRMGRTVLLTFATTAIGFMSVAISGIEALAQFGLLASLGLLFNFVATIVFIPAALTLAGHWRFDWRVLKLRQRLRSRVDGYWRLLCATRWRIALLTSGVILVALAGIPRIEVSHSPIDSLGEASPTTGHIEHLNNHFAGLESFSIVVSSGIQDTFLHSRYLGEVVELQEFVRGLLPDASVTSFADYLVLLNNALLETPDAGMPTSNEEITELMLFLDHAKIASYVTPGFSETRIIVRHSITEAPALRELFATIREFATANIDTGLDVKITGDSILTLSATRSMLLGQAQSVILIISLFVIIVGVLFTDLRVGLVAAVPNLVPLFTLFGLMGFADIPLNIGTAMAAAIALGIAVDDTLHFVLRYNQALRESRSQSLAMHATLSAEALPVVATSIALIAGFLVFTQSGFTPVAQFGLLSAFVIAMALLADLVLTPLMISTLRLVSIWDLLNARLRRQVIPRSPLFRDMREWQIRKFVLSSTLHEYAPGEAVYRYGDPSNELFLVMKGAVEVTVPTDGAATTKSVVDQFGSGQVFGDVALLADELRQTNAVALTPTTLLVLSRESIANVTQLHPFLASRLFLNLARDVSCRWVAFITRAHPADDDNHNEDSR